MINRTYTVCTKKNDLILNYMTKFSRVYLRTELYLI